jgi:hypothetical protein
LVFGTLLRLPAVWPKMCPLFPITKSVLGSSLFQLLFTRALDVMEIKGLEEWEKTQVLICPGGDLSEHFPPLS